VNEFAVCGFKLSTLLPQNQSVIYYFAQWKLTKWFCVLAVEKELRKTYV